MKENKISITVDWDLEYSEESLNREIENAVIDAATKKYLEKLDNTFAEKLETMLHEQAYKIVKGINRFQLDKCNKDGLKETISMEDYIIKKSIESIDVKRDSYGRTGHNANSEQRTMIEWTIKDIVTRGDNEFIKSLKKEIIKIENEYQNKLQDMVTKTLAPVYKKLVEKLNN